VERLLTDPNSAQFRELHAYPAAGTPAAVCGEVNAKNRMGGYNGFQRFIFRVAVDKVELAPGTDQQALVDPLTAAIQSNEFNVDFLAICSDTQLDIGNGIANGA
jgi:hypothetical protein